MTKPFTVTLAYSYREHGTLTVEVDAANERKAEQLALERLHCNEPDRDDLDVSDISIAALA